MHEEIRVCVVHERSGWRREVTRIPADSGDPQLIELLARRIAGAARARLSGTEANRATWYGHRAVVEGGQHRAKLFVEDLERLFASIHEESDVRIHAVDLPGDRDVVPAASLKVEPGRVF